MLCGVTINNLSKLGRGKSGLHPCCVTTLSGFFIGVDTMATIKTNCPTCGKEFMVNKHHFDRNGGKAYCCRQCFYDSLKKLTTICCAMCGETVSYTARGRGRRVGLFCSRRCSGLASRGSDHPLWKGGIYKKGNTGYLMEYDPVRFVHVRQHRLIMENHIGRRLTKDEIVHHKNGIRDDNRLENLQLMTITEHKSLHMTRRHAERRALNER